MIRKDAVNTNKPTWFNIINTIFTFVVIKFYSNKKSTLKLSP